MKLTIYDALMQFVKISLDDVDVTGSCLQAKSGAQGEIIREDENGKMATVRGHVIFQLEEFTPQHIANIVNESLFGSIA